MSSKTQKQVRILPSQFYPAFVTVYVIGSFMVLKILFVKFEAVM